MTNASGKSKRLCTSFAMNGQSTALPTAAATAIARRLNSLGIGPGALVGLCLERSATLPAAVLGVLESGAAYVPMDPAFPAERLRMMAEDAALAAILTQRSLVDHLPEHDARVLLQRPEWVFMDEATSALDDAGQANVMTLLAEDLPDTAVVSIGHRPGLEAFHTRELVLEPGEDGANLRARAGQRGLRDIYRRMSAASRAEPTGPGFWSYFRRTLSGR